MIETQGTSRREEKLADYLPTYLAELRGGKLVDIVNVWFNKGWPSDLPAAMGAVCRGILMLSKPVGAERLTGPPHSTTDLLLIMPDYQVTDVTLKNIAQALRGSGHVICGSQNAELLLADRQLRLLGILGEDVSGPQLFRTITPQSHPEVFRDDTEHYYVFGLV